MTENRSSWRTENVGHLEGTQVGFLTSPFDCETIDGEAIIPYDFKGNWVMILNVTGCCYSAIPSYEYYKQLYYKYSGQLKFLAIDQSKVGLENAIKKFNLSGSFTIGNQNNLLEENYREDYCYRMCFLINPEGRIVDKFEILTGKKKWPPILIKNNHK